VQNASDACRISLSGDAVAKSIDHAIVQFRRAIDLGRPICVDVSNVDCLDARMFGLFLMVRKQMANQGLSFLVVGASRRLRRTFRLNKFEFLLS
jgi:N-acetylglucosaminyldiphosphoundecaprenol N-acetyl-beta-D-mannosaminyltransferase